MDQTHYDLLGVSRTASKEEIRAAYRQRMREVHPDVNPAADSTARAARINEANRILTDDSKRRAYDALLDARLNMSGHESDDEYAGASEAAPPDIRCQRCGVQNASLRISVFYRAIGALIRAYRQAKAGLWCDRCRALESIPDSVISLIAGWWCFPWGPFFVLQAALTNLIGGEKPAKENAAMLRMLAHILYNHGDQAEAFAAAKASQRFESDPAMASWLASQPSRSADRSRMQWTLVPAVPVAVFAAIVAVVMYVKSQEPSGYEARYQPVVTAGVVPTPTKVEDPHRKRANEAMERLAGIIHSRSPIVGTEQRGNATVRHYELDRGKFDLAELRTVQQAVDHELSLASNDADGFVASCAFNARVFTASVDLMQGVDAGRDVHEAITALRAIGDDERISPWLRASQFNAHYEALLSLVREIGENYQSGQSVAELRQTIESDSKKLDDVKATLARLENSDDIDAYNRNVDRHNALLDRLRAMARTHETNTSLLSRLDDVANACLDRELLLTRFDTVNLATPAGESE